MRQQGWFEPPHAVQVPGAVPVHIVAAWVHIPEPLASVQQAWPRKPQPVPPASPLPPAGLHRTWLHPHATYW